MRLNSWGHCLKLATISHEDGLDLLSDRDQISAQWDSAIIVPAVTPFFQLITLRNMDAHKTSLSATTELADALKAFGIDQTQCVAGWGLALDRVYDTILSSLSTLNTLIDESWA